MDDSLPIPERTRKRDGKYQDAARLYIHKRMTNFAELARIVGLPNSVHLLRVKDLDKWDDFTAQVASSQITSVWGQLAQLDGWSPDSFARVKEERDRQIALLPALVAQRERIIQTMEGLEVGSKSHSSSCSSLRTLSELLERMSGLERFWRAAEAQAKRQDGTQQSQFRETKGAVIEL